MMERQSRKDLEFDRVLEEIGESCLSAEGRAALFSLPFSQDRQVIEQRQEIVSAFIRLMASGMVRLPSPLPDLAEFFRKNGDLRYSPDGLTLYSLCVYLESASSFIAFCHGTLTDNQRLDAVASLFAPQLDPSLCALGKDIASALQADGTVKPTHPAIARLIREVEDTRQGRMKFAREYIVAHREKVQSEQGAFRDGRLVIPMRTDRSQNGDGFVTGTSQTGNTMFVEPFRLVELNNQVTMAQNQILVETARILKEFSDRARSLRDEFSALSAQIAYADQFYALARYAHLHSMNRTDLDRGLLDLRQARHPLLGRNVVPISIRLSPKVKAVVFSGPNAGGKTVTIKTVGLLSMLNELCGYIPALEGSSLPLFDDVFTEIGDEQSIEEGLSTFSSHMRRIAFILHHFTDKSLVILDELGSGTDPVEGSALARSILEECLSHASLALVTSHHGVLKEFAYAREDVLNASMEFDESSHKPTFRVVQGVPGDSHALDTARAMDVPQAVIKRAKEYLGSSAVQIGEIIKGLEQKRQELLSRQATLEEQKRSLATRLAEVERRELAVRRSSLTLKDEQSTDLARFMREKNSELERLVAELKRDGVTREKTIAVKQYVTSLKQKKDETDDWLRQEEESLTPDTDETPFVVGDPVLCGRARREGVIVRVLGKGSYQVAIGPMKMTLKGHELARPKRSEKPSVQVVFSGKTPAPVMEMDVRGLTLEESLSQLDQEIERCLVHGVTQFSVIHGYGDGILSRGIGEYLKKHPSVRDYRFAMPEDGGMGKTYVFL
jgi:DNA mismatch repair protein MutS2